MRQYSQHNPDEAPGLEMMLDPGCNSVSRTRPALLRAKAKPSTRSVQWFSFCLHEKPGIHNLELTTSVSLVPLDIFDPDATLMFDRDREEESIPEVFTASALRWGVRPRWGEGMPLIGNTTRMSNGGGTDTGLATMTMREWYQHHVHRGEHMGDRHPQIETGSGSTVRERYMRA